MKIPSLLASTFCLALPLQAAPADGWTDLFNGKNLDGWMVKCRPGDKNKHYWKADDGAITATVPKGWNWKHAGDSDAWNDIHIICKGTRVKTIVNGVTVCDYDGKGRLDDEHHRTRQVGIDGHIGLQIHPGGTMRIRFKDIQVKPVK